MVCYKKREDRHRSRLDIHILKNGFQTHAHQDIDKHLLHLEENHKDRHCSHLYIYILKNGFHTHSLEQGECVWYPFFKMWVFWWLRWQSLRFFSRIKRFRSHGSTFISPQSGGSRMGFTTLISQAFFNILLISYKVLVVLTIPRNDQPEWKLK